jgi:hypothetical protein
MYPPETVGQISEHRTGDVLYLRWSWRTPFTDALTLLVGAGIAVRLVVWSDVPLVVDLVLVGMVLAMIQTWRNATTIEVGPKGLTIADGPVTWGKPTRLDRREVAGIRIVEQRINWVRQYSLVADVHRDGGLKEVQLFARTPRGQVVRHLEGRIKRALLGRA